MAWHGMQTTKADAGLPRPRADTAMLYGVQQSKGQTSSDDGVCIQKTRGNHQDKRKATRFPEETKERNGGKGTRAEQGSLLAAPRNTHEKRALFLFSNAGAAVPQEHEARSIYTLAIYEEIQKKQSENRVSGPTRVCMYRCMLVPYVNYLTAVWFTTIPFRSPTRWRKVLTCWMYAQKHTYCSSTLKAIRC